MKTTTGFISLQTDAVITTTTKNHSNYKGPITRAKKLTKTATTGFISSQPGAGTTTTTAKKSPINRVRKRQLTNKQTKKLIPFTEIEWKYVQRKFMSEDLDDLKELRDIMNMWITRMWHDTPVFIGISELVLRALVLEQRTRQSPAQMTLDNADVGLIYGSVIIRFINYVNEICQPEGNKVMLSIANAVSKMGIPSWIVALRHEATHGQMPPMNMMKEAIKFCRVWLLRQHWSKPLTDAIIQTLPEIYEKQQAERECMLGNRMVNVLQSFKQWRIKYPSLTEFHPIVPNPNVSASDGQDNRCQLSIREMLDTHAEEFVRFFVQTCLAQVDHDPNMHIYDKENHQGSATAFTEGTMFCNDDKYIDTINAHEQNYYKPIFHLMNARGFLQALLLEVIRCIAVPGEIQLEQRRHLAGWADKLLSAYFMTPSSVSIQNWRIILKHIVLAPQLFHNCQLIKLFDVLGDNISIKCRTRLKGLLNIRDPHFDEQTSTALSNSGDHQHQSIMDCSTRSIKTLADLQSRIHQEECADNTFVRDPLTLEEDWSLASPEELGPLGLTADQKADTLCLALGFDLLCL